jgi:hypothetical protein
VTNTHYLTAPASLLTTTKRHYWTGPFDETNVV